jgi:hypothetical protein
MSEQLKGQLRISFCINRIYASGRVRPLEFQRSGHSQQTESDILPGSVMAEEQTFMAILLTGCSVSAIACPYHQLIW